MKSVKLKKAFHISAFLLTCAVVCAGFLILSNFICESAVSTSNSSAPGADNSQVKPGSSREIPTVYMTTDISPAGLDAVYKALGRKLTGKVAVKLSTVNPEAITSFLRISSKIWLSR